VSLLLDNVIHFPEHGVPSSTFSNPTQTTLFVPTSPHYPGFAFFIWYPEELRLLGFQVTIVKPFTRHTQFSSSDIASNIDQWKKYCGAELFELHWIIPQKCWIQANSCRDNKVTFFHDIYNELKLACF
jgi:hypothetical protein